VERISTSQPLKLAALTVLLSTLSVVLMPFAAVLQRPRVPEMLAVVPLATSPVLKCAVLAKSALATDVALAKPTLLQPRFVVV